VIFLIYKSDKPYPKILINDKNSEYAMLLLSLFSGQTSELTAINLYTYQEIISDKYKEIFKEIAKVEMHHLEILGTMIYKLGGYPVYGYYSDDSVFRLWNSSNVKYYKNINDMLKHDISSEEEAINNYYKAISLIDDNNINTVLYRIIEDEKIHLKIFNNLYNQKEC
jgi:bacterioferritin